MFKNSLKVIASAFSLVFIISFCLAQTYSIDISGLKQEPYSIGDQLTFKVVLLQNNTLISDAVDVTIFDELGKKMITKTVTSNQQESLLIEKDFPSLTWHIKASYKTEEVDRTFSVKENSQVEFSIEGDKLIIKNIGNVRYTRTVQLTIGTETNSYAQNIKVGGQKELLLIAPEGNYDIKITDGENTFNKQGVKLVGTGNAIGAIDPSLQGTGLLGSPVDPNKVEDSFINSNRLPLALVFVGAVFGLGVLLFIENRLSKRGKNL